MNKLIRLALFLVSLLFPFLMTAQSKPPRLAVGIVVDQMRYDYLLKYFDKYGKGGFRRLLAGGFNCENAHYNYAPTYTGPGHAAIFSGTTPAVNGIIGNDWYSRPENMIVYCVRDTGARAVGGSAEAGKVSPRRLRSTSLGDEMRLFSNKKCKVVSVALKDRASILPAGHCPTAAYWFDSKTAGWMTSNWFASELPSWVKQFNQQELPAKLTAEKWSPLPETLLDSRSIADDNRFEDTLKGDFAPIFPHNLPEFAQKRGSGEALLFSPFGNSFTAEFAKSAIENEQLGQDAWPDLLTLSFSSTDILGHSFGPTSVEVEDVYLRLDQTLADFFEYLDKKVGKNEWLVFLTADHGVSYNSNFLLSEKIPAAAWSREKLRDSLNKKLTKTFGSKKLVLAITNGNVYFDHQKIDSLHLDFQAVERASIAFFENYDGVQAVLTDKNLKENEFSQPPKSLVQRGFLPERSGDLVVVFAPGWVEWGDKGTSHGSPWSYDTRIPCLFYGKNIQKGQFSGRVNITDIAPTAAVLLNVPFPNGCTGEPIEAILSPRKK